MAIVESFFDQQKAGEINAIINNNFRNTAKYIPVGFDTLTTVERVNLGEDWKDHGKIVLDIDDENVYMWNEDEADWVLYLLKAQDETAREWAEQTKRRAFCDVEFGNTKEGKDQYTLYFYNEYGKSSVTVDPLVKTLQITADKIKYDSTFSVLTKIQDLIKRDNELQSSIDDINGRLGDTALPTTAGTITGAINEIHGEVDKNRQDIDNIQNGDFVVPEASHAKNADMAKDSEKLGGQLPEYYATEADRVILEERVTANEGTLQVHETTLNDLRTDLDKQGEDLASFHTDYDTTVTVVSNLGERVDTIEQTLEDMDGAVVIKAIVEKFPEDGDMTGILDTIVYSKIDGDMIKKGSTAVIAGQEQKILTDYIQEEYSTAPQEGWCVADTLTPNVWAYETYDEDTSTPDADISDIAGDNIETRVQGEILDECLKCYVTIPESEQESLTEFDLDLFKTSIQGDFNIAAKDIQEKQIQKTIVVYDEETETSSEETVAVRAIEFIYKECKVVVDKDGDSSVIAVIREELDAMIKEMKDKSNFTLDNLKTSVEEKYEVADEDFQKIFESGVETLSFPYGDNKITVDSTGNVYVTDNGNAKQIQTKTAWVNYGELVKNGTAVYELSTGVLWVYCGTDTLEWRKIGANQKMIQQDSTKAITAEDQTKGVPFNVTENSVDGLLFSDGYNTIGHFDKDTDSIIVYMNGAYVPKCHYELDLSKAEGTKGVILVKNPHQDTSPWAVDWEVTIVVTQMRPDINGY